MITSEVESRWLSNQIWFPYVTC